MTDLETRIAAARWNLQTAQETAASIVTSRETAMRKAIKEVEDYYEGPYWAADYAITEARAALNDLLEQQKKETNHEQS